MKDKYYKSFIYEKHENNNIEYWYDENGIVRKLISYRGDGTILSEEYYDDKGLSHNEDGPAYQEWDEIGKPLIQKYYLHGIQLTEDEWKQKTSKKEETNVITSNSPVNFSYDLKCDFKYILY